MREVLTREMTCKKLNCSRSKFQQMEKAGLFPLGSFFTIGSRKYFFSDKLDIWLESGGEMGARIKLQKGE